MEVVNHLVCKRTWSSRSFPGSKRPNVHDSMTSMQPCIPSVHFSPQGRETSPFFLRRVCPLDPSDTTWIFRSLCAWIFTLRRLQAPDITPSLDETRRRTTPRNARAAAGAEWTAENSESTTSTRLYRSLLNMETNHAAAVGDVGRKQSRMQHVKRHSFGRSRLLETQVSGRWRPVKSGAGSCGLDPYRRRFGNLDASRIAAM